MRREITDFERKLYQSVQGDIQDIAEISICEGYFTTTYSKADLEEIGAVVTEEQMYEELLSRGEEAFNAEIERQRQECKEYEAYIALQCELTERAREGADACVTA